MEDMGKNICRYNFFYRFSALFFLVAWCLTTPFTVEGLAGTVNRGDAHCVVEFRGGSMNWSVGIIEAKGGSSDTEVLLDGGISRGVKNTIPDGKSNHGIDLSLESMEARAVASARKNIIQIFDAIVGGQERRVAENGYSIHMLKAQIEKKALNAHLTVSRELMDGAVAVVLTTDIYGDFLKLILPRELRQIPDIEVIDPGNQYGNRTQYTGLVIDARDIGFKPVISPTVLSEQGEEIYGPMFASRAYAVEKGVCSYAYTPETEIIERRVGENPLTIKGLRKEGDNNETIVITISDADKIQRIPERHKFMKACKVLILVSRSQ